jgi:hypothetical protein
VQIFYIRSKLNQRLVLNLERLQLLIVPGAPAARQCPPRLLVVLKYLGALKLCLAKSLSPTLDL